MYRNDAMACKIQQRRLKLLSFAYKKKNDVQTQSGVSTFRNNIVITSDQSQRGLRIHSKH